MRDVRAGDTAGVERTQGQLRAGLADRLGGDDAHRVADRHELAGGHRHAVAALADARVGLALQHRPHRDHEPVRSLAEALADLLNLRSRDQLVRLEHLLARDGEVTRREAARQRRVVDRDLDGFLGTAVLLTHDHVLGHVHEAPRQVARVGGTQGRVGQALTRAVGRDEVLEHRQALHEVGLDRALDDLALRVRHQASHAGELADLLERATRARVGHHEDRVEDVQVLLHRLTHLIGGRRPLLDDALVALLLRDQARVVLVLDLAHLALVAVEDGVLLGRDDDVVLRHRDAGLRREPEAQVLERVEHEGDRVRTVQVHERLDHVVHVALLQRLVDERVLVRVVALLERLLERALDALVEDDPPDGREHVATGAAAPVLGQVVQAHHAVLVRELGLLRGAEHVRTLAVLLLVPLARGDPLLELVELVRLGTEGQVVRAQHHVLGGRRERRAVRRREDVVRRQHQEPRLGLGLGGQRKVHGHLVAVEVGVERLADERVDLDRLALDEHRLERLQAETVERRSAVQQDRVLLDDLLEHIPHLGDHRVDHLLGRLDVLHRLALDEPGHDERLEQLEGHQLRQAALVQPQRRARHDHRSAGVVDALAEQVLAEPALLALQHVGQRLERAVAGARDRAPAAAVVEQSVDGLLEHPLLVVDDDLRRAQVQQPLQAVVPVDDAAVEVVQVGGREAATVELDHRAELRRDHRDRLEDHVFGPVVGVDERRYDLQALHRARLLLALRGLDLVLEVGALGVQVDLLEQVADRLGAHAAAEVLAETVRRTEPVLEFPEDRLVRDDVLRLHVAEQVPDLADPLGRVLDVGLRVGDVRLERLAEVLEHLLAVLVGQLLHVDVEAVGPEVVLLREAGLLAGREVLLAALERLAQLEDALLLLGGVAVEDLVDLLLELGQVLVAGLVVDPGDDRSGEVQDLLELLRSHVEQVADPRRDALEEPDVRYGRRQVHVAHALTADLRARDLDAAALADDALVADALVLAAVALPVLRGTEDALAEEAVLLRLERPVVDGLRLGYFTRRPAPDLLRRSETD